MAARLKAFDRDLRDTVYPMDMASYRRDMVYLRKSERRRGEPRKWRPHPENSDWAFLSDPLERALVDAVQHGKPVAPVLREYGIVPMSYYRWLWVGEGRMRRWSDGRPIQPDVRQRYWQFAVAIAEARLQHAAECLEQLRDLQHVQHVQR